MSNRYDVSGNPEAQYQPGSDGTVLLNKLGVTDAEEIDGIEFDLLLKAEEELFEEIDVDQKVTCKDLMNWHHRWLATVYEWAGGYRTVNMQKDDFMFAAANLIPKLMMDYESKFLSRYTPCCSFTDSQLVEAMALCHVEFVLIHPFREGNGRLGRLLTTVMALQANKPPLDFEHLVQNKADYISAIHAGHAGNYGPMRAIFSEILKTTMGSL